MRKLQVGLLVAGAAVIAVLAFMLRDRNEELRNATHGRTADSLARNTQEATTLLATADTQLKIVERHFTVTRLAVDTVRLPADARAVIRACDTLAISCRERSRRSDSLVAALRRELEHAQHPPPGPRLAFRLRGGRDLLSREWEAAIGPRYRVAGPLEAFAELGNRAFTDTLGRLRTEARIVVGGEITFGRGRR